MSQNLTWRVRLFSSTKACFHRKPKPTCSTCTTHMFTHADTNACVIFDCMSACECEQFIWSKGPMISLPSMCGAEEHQGEKIRRDTGPRSSLCVLDFQARGQITCDEPGRPESACAGFRHAHAGTDTHPPTPTSPQTHTQRGQALICLWCSCIFSQINN